MKTGLSMLLAVTACLLFFNGCKKTAPPPVPEFQVTVPAGWQVVAENDQEGEQTKILANAGLQTVKIIVACLPSDKYRLEVIVAENLAIISQVGGVITQFDVADDRSSVRLAFTAESEQTGRFVGKLAAKKDSSGRGKVLTIIGLWAEADDAAVSPAFGALAVSADFK